MGENFYNDMKLLIDGCPMDEIPEFTWDERDMVRSKIIITDTAVISLTCKIDKYSVLDIFGLSTWVSSYCPNRRIRHLIKHGKNVRVRRKNLIRGLRLMGGRINISKGDSEDVFY